MSQDDIARDNYQYFSYCRQNGHDRFLRDAETAIAFFVGEQWTEEERSKMRETGRPALTINQFFRDMDSIIGEMIYSTGDVRFSPLDNGSSDVSDALDKVYVATAQRNRLSYIEPRVLLMGMLTGRAYFDVRVDFDQQMMGQITLKALRPQNVVLNPELDDPDPDKWPEVFTTRYASYNDIALAYGDVVAKELQETPQASWLEPYDSAAERPLNVRYNGTTYDPTYGDPKLLRSRRLIERQYRELKYKDFFVDTTTGDMSEVPENWDRNRIARMVEVSGVNVIKRRTQTIRWRVSCDRFLLHDEDSPYNHFTVVPFFPYFVDGHPMSLGGQLIDMQRFTNKLYSQELHILNSAANSGWKVKKGSLNNMTDEELEQRGAETGLTMVLDDVKDAERIQPGQLPQGHDNLARTITEKFHEISGYTQTLQGADRADASRKALDAKLSRGTVNLATAYNALYYAKTLLADRVCDLVQTYYTETRVLRFNGGIGQEPDAVTINQPTPEGLITNDVTRGTYTTTIIPAPSRETVEQNTFQQLKEMRAELGIMIPDEVMVQYSAIPQKSRVLESLKRGGADDQAQQRAAQLQEQLQMADLQARAAQAANSAAQAELAKARAAKALSDAQSNNQGDRIALDRERLYLEHSRDRQRMAQEKTDSERDTALRLTDMEMQHRAELANQKETPTKQPPRGSA